MIHQISSFPTNSAVQRIWQSNGNRIKRHVRNTLSRKIDISWIIFEVALVGMRSHLTRPMKVENDS